MIQFSVEGGKEEKLVGKRSRRSEEKEQVLRALQQHERLQASRDKGVQ